MLRVNRDKCTCLLGNLICEIMLKSRLELFNLSIEWTSVVGRINVILAQNL